jgi:hypothetical protein
MEKVWELFAHRAKQLHDDVIRIELTKNGEPNEKPQTLQL